MSSSLDNRRKQILYRANHRGIKEMDILLGGYATKHVHDMSEKQLDDFETIMAESDRDLIMWFTNESPIPEQMDTPLFHAILSHMTNKE